MAEAEAIKARADALAENQDAVIGQQLAENWPAIVEAAAKPFGDIDQMIVLNGATGLSDALAQALSQGVAGMQLARTMLKGGLTGEGEASNGKGNGHGRRTGQGGPGPAGHRRHSAESRPPTSPCEAAPSVAGTWLPLRTSQTPVRR